MGNIVLCDSMTAYPVSFTYARAYMRTPITYLFCCHAVIINGSELIAKVLTYDCMPSLVNGGLSLLS